MSKKKPHSDNIIAQNRKARADYELLDFYEAGLSLKGTEVKSLRNGQGQITEAYVGFTSGEAWLLNGMIPKYSHASDYMNHDERRSRKLLLHAHEIRQLKESVERDGLTVVPLKLFWKGGKAKLEIAVAKGRKKHDKRQAVKERDWNRQRQKLLKEKY